MRALRLFAHVEGLLLAGLTVLAWCCEGMTLLLIGHSLGLELHILDTLQIIVLASLFAAIPAAPGYAGTFDAGLVLGLKAVGVTGGTAVGFVVLARFVMFVPVTLVGLFLLLHTYGGFRPRRGGSEVLGDAGRLAVEDPPAERERDDDDARGISSRSAPPMASAADGRGRVDRSRGASGSEWRRSGRDSRRAGSSPGPSS